jgi:hypothetical protein
VPRSKDTLTELEYEIYLERYHNICHEISAIRTKTAILMGIVGVVFTLLVALYANRPADEELYALIIGLLGCVCLPILVNYFIIYIHIHSMDMTEYPDKQTLKDFNSDDINGFYHYSKQTYLKEINIRLKDISDNLSLRYKFYNKISSAVDILFFVFFGMGGIILICRFIDLPIADFSFILLLVALLLFSGCFTTIVILGLGYFEAFRKWVVFGSKYHVIIGCILFTLFVWFLTLWRIYG